MLVMIVCFSGCNCDNKSFYSDPQYSPQENFCLILDDHTIFGGECFVLVNGGEFTVIKLLPGDKLPTVITGQASSEGFSALLQEIRKIRLLEQVQKRIAVVPDTPIYLLDFVNGESCRQLRFLPNDSRFKPLVRIIRSITSDGAALEQARILQVLRKLLKIDRKFLNYRVARTLVYLDTYESRSLLRDLIKTKKVPSSFSMYLEDSDEE